MQEKAGQAWHCGSLGPWYASNITSDQLHGIGGWTDAELKQYLKGGRVAGRAQAAGRMAEAVSNSLSRLADGDLNAIIAHLRTIPAGDHGEPQRAAFTWGDPDDSKPILRWPPTALSGGAEMFEGLCATCHRARGTGKRDE